MSVVAGSSMFRGVMLAADTRSTIVRPGSSAIYVDNVQKLFAMTPRIALGFVGDIRVAGLIIIRLVQALRSEEAMKRGRPHPGRFIHCSRDSCDTTIATSLASEMLQ
jgi:20S proteasome alpha/beta subunit